jgi:hypothetical protein
MSLKKHANGWLRIEVPMTQLEREKAIPIVDIWCENYLECIAYHLGVASELDDLYGDRSCTHYIPQYHEFIAELDEMERDMKSLIRKRDLIKKFILLGKPPEYLDSLVRDFFIFRKSLIPKWTVIENNVECALVFLKSRNDV